MEYAVILVGFILLMSGLIGSFLPIIPGPPLAWLGLLSIYLIPETPKDYWLLGISFSSMLVVSIADFFIPAYYTKKKGGTKFASWGSSIGLLTGFIFFPPLGLIIGAFLGALIGELISNPNIDLNKAFQTAWGALLGLIVSTLMKFFLCLSFLFVFIYKIFELRNVLF